MSEEKEGLEDLAARVDAIAPGFGGLVRLVEANDREIERVRALIEQATAGVNSNVLLVALGLELRRVVTVVKGPVDDRALAIDSRGNVYVRREGWKREG